MKTLLTGVEFFHVDMQTDRQTDTTRISVDFTKFFRKRASEIFCCVSDFATLDSFTAALYQNTTEPSFIALITLAEFRPHLATCLQSLMINYISIPNEKGLLYCSV
jgi:hypothetical protein